ncbi:MAG: prolipoprotein diacylglyceryl transferase [Porticoccaceae bacterium]|nr:prolipoprotein diacylglyceryl transferase [Porticoccaceae bacterium]
MLNYPEIDPVALSFGPIEVFSLNIGPLHVHWYGLMYLLAFALAWALAIRNCRESWSPIQKSQVEDLIVFGAWGVILGGRLGYMLFYSMEQWLADPLLVLRLWEGGMSFHGGLLGVMFSALLYARKQKLSFFSVTDFIAPLVPTGLFFGRIGNFIGQELWGRPSELPWAMLFPADSEQLYRHPSQLYEALGEGVLLFILVNWFARRPRQAGAVSGVFLLGYGVARFLVEFVRQPDPQFLDESATFGLIDWMTRGQLLCLPMILGGLWLCRKSFQIFSIYSKGG